jgi:hypothetical protein
MAEPSDLDRTISTVLATLAGGGQSAEGEPPVVQVRGSGTYRGVDLKGFYDPETDTLSHGYPVRPGGTP